MTVVLMDDRKVSLQEAMATHSRVLAWRIPWTEEPGEPQPWGHTEPTGLND